VAKGVIADGERGFSSEAAVPVGGMESVADFDLSGHFRVMEKTAITKDLRIFAKNNCERRR